MSSSAFQDFFQKATGNPPYDYQVRLAEAPCKSRLISIPTGLGKTAAVVLAGLWNCMHRADPKPPRAAVLLPKPRLATPKS